MAFHTVILDECNFTSCKQYFDHIDVIKLIIVAPIIVVKYVPI